MLNKKTQGFTLIELLIVIAIIGILAAVLIPNLLNARVQANIRAAQAFSSNVNTAVTAALAEDISAVPSDFDNADCTGTAATPVGSYSYSASPANVTGCVIAGNDTSGTITVTVTIPEGDIINGQVQF